MLFHFEFQFDLPRSAVFAFYEDPGHLALVHRDWTTFRMIHHDGNLRPGSETWVETTVAGILPVVMGFKHTVYDPPHHFAEVLIHGPFRRFSHLHEFEDAGTGTVVRDFLDVELPWHYGGALATKYLVAPILDRIFDLRKTTLLKLAGSGAMMPAPRDERPPA